MLKIKKYYFFKSILLKPLKREIEIVYKLNCRLSIFYRRQYYLLFTGIKFSFLRLNTLHFGNKFSQFVFNKKPFSGPIKKFNS